MTTYATLTTQLQDICENTFTDDNLAMFFQHSEQKIYQTVQFPALRKVHTTAMVSGTATYSLPSDFLYPIEFAVVSASGAWTYLLEKDVNFIREAYPVVSSTGTPKHYAMYNDTQAILGPTPNSNFSCSLTYGYYPESIVTAGTTWLGDNYDVALLNGALVEAIRFMKGPEDMVALYEKLYVQAVALLKNSTDGKLRQDMYRDGQVKVAVK